MSITVAGKRNIDIGRDSHLDWTLPDPTRFISSKHCEVRFKDGGYWLHDVSTNGTFLNGGDHRMQAPHRLRTGDRFTIGHYIIVAAVDGEGEGAVAPASLAAPVPSAGPAEYWGNEGDVPPPIDPRELKDAKRNVPVNPDFLDWAADVPNEFNTPSPAPAPSYAPPPGGGFSAPQPLPAFSPQPAPLQGFAPPPSPPPGFAPLPFTPQPAAGFAPPPIPAPRTESPALPPDSLDWDAGPPSRGPAPPPPPLPTPTPRRGDWTGKGAENPWEADGAPAPATPEPAVRPAPEPPPEQPPAPAARSLPPAANLSAALPVESGPVGSSDEFLRRLARAAGLPEDAFAQRRPEEVADQIGDTLRLMAENLMQLLNARVQAKRLARSASHTTIQALDNNPLKFSPSAQDALRIMFGPPSRAYLDAHRTIEQSFSDLKAHQIKTYSAMQHALSQLMKDFDPEAIEADTDADRGIGALLTSRKAKLWDSFVARYQAKVRREDGGLIEAFMLYFSEYYDRDGG